MENWAEIRRRVLADGLSGRAACREYKIHWKTLKKILDNTEPPGYRRNRSKPPPILDPLRAEHGYQGGLTMVKGAVRAWRIPTAEVFVPLAHPPGEAQADFGHAEVVLDGQPTKVAVFVMTMPYSDAIFACTF